MTTVSVPYTPRAPSKFPYPPTATPDEVHRARKLLDACKLRILRTSVFSTYSSLASCGETIITTGVDTAETDGWNVLYNPHLVIDFAKAGPAYLNMLVLHETFHKAFGHCDPKGFLTRVDKDDQQLVEWALDCFVNTALHHLDEERRSKAPDGAASAPFVRFPDWCIQPRVEMRKKSTAQIFRWLKDQPPSSDQGGSMDTHVRRVANSAKGAANKPVPPNLAAIVKKELISGALRDAMLGRAAGTGVGSAAGDLLGKLTAPRIKYTSLIRDWLRTTNVPGAGFASWARTDRRALATGRYLPGSVRREGGVLCVQVDVSASDWHEIPKFMSEIQGLIEEMKPKEVHVLQTDTVVQRHDVLNGRRLQDVERINLQGRGGTNLCEGFRYLQEKKIKVDAVITMTDGYTGFPSPELAPMRTLWVISTQGLQSPIGTTVFLDTSD